jgi:hypothetical protein
MNNGKKKGRGYDPQPSSLRAMRNLASYPSLLCGCQRDMWSAWAVTRAFSRLKEIGAVQLKERHIIVKDLGALEGLAEAG